MDEFDKHLRSTNIPEVISSALSEGPGSTLAIVVTKQKHKSQIVGLVNIHHYSLNKNRSNQNYKLQVKSANCNCYKYSFFVNIICEWNDLLANVIEIGNLRRFKIALKSYMRIS